MKITVDSQEIFTSKYDGVALFTYEDGSDAELRFKTKLGRNIVIAREKKEFEGKPRQLFSEKQPDVPRFFLLVGLGKKKDTTLDTLRTAASVAANTLRAAGAKMIAIELPQELDTTLAAQAAVEGALLGTYQYTQYKTQKRDEIKELAGIAIIAGKDTEAAKKGAGIGQTIADSCNYVRDLQNTPSSDLTPALFAQAATKLAKEQGLKCVILDKQQLMKQGFGGIVGVGRGSSAEPRMVTLEYAPKGAKKSIAIVGKGITFDSGGISIKPSSKMGDMKFDMSGAANVLGIMKNANALKLPIRVIGILCLAENMPDGGAYKPGDVVTTKNGKTIEIDNTDAEGRVVLADGLYHATTFKPDVIIDMATLTGAAVVALGDVAAAMLGNNQEAMDRVTAASKATGEKVWQLPLWDDYAEDIKSQIADMKNVGIPGSAGTIAGAMLLREFVGDTPWVHLDIAGVAYSQGRERYFTPYGGTAYGVRLVTQYLRGE